MALQRWFQQAAQNSESNGGSVIAGAAKSSWPYGLARRMAASRRTRGDRRRPIAGSLGKSRQEGRDIVRVAYMADQGVLVLSLEMPERRSITQASSNGFRVPIACNAPLRICQDCERRIRIRARGYVMRLGRKAFIR